LIENSISDYNSGSALLSSWNDAKLFSPWHEERIIISKWVSGVYFIDESAKRLCWQLLINGSAISYMKLLLQCGLIGDQQARP
jgi:hypothetical protein